MNTSCCYELLQDFRTTARDAGTARAHTQLGILRSVSSRMMRAAFISVFLAAGSAAQTCAPARATDQELESPSRKRGWQDDENSIHLHGDKDPIMILNSRRMHSASTLAHRDKVRTCESCGRTDDKHWRNSFDILLAQEGRVERGRSPDVPRLQMLSRDVREATCAA